MAQRPTKTQQAPVIIVQYASKLKNDEGLHALTSYRLEDTAFLMDRQQARDPWNCKALQFNLENLDSNPLEPEEHCFSLHSETQDHSQQEESVGGLVMPMMRSPFEEVACQDKANDSPSRLPSWHEATPYRLPRKPLAELQTCRCSHDDSDSIRMDDLQSTVRLLSMSFGN